MDVSVILVSYNTEELTKNCLKSLYEQTMGVNFDVWVVDNASSDNSVQMIKEQFPQVNLIASEENLGFGRANNLAINKISSKYVFLLNTDTILLNNAVKILFDYMKKPDNANVGVCGGQLYNSDMTLQGSIGEFDTLEKICKKAIGVDLGRIMSRFKKKISGNEVFSSVYDPDYIIGADMMLRKEALNKSGLFDERFFMYGEEAELCLRIKNSGYRVKFVPESKILHYGGGSSVNRNTQIQVEKMILENTLLFMQIAYGEKVAKQAKLYFILYYLRYLPLRFFAPKAIKRLWMAIQA